jgi:hypothetical protein
MISSAASPAVHSPFPLQTKRLTSHPAHTHAYTQTDNMRSERQILASRANGAKSRGPVTPEGRLASAGNRTDHGLLAAATTLPGESEERLAALSEAFHQRLQPRDEIEVAYVESMIMCRWRLMRLWVLESAGMGHEIRRQSHMHESETEPVRAALALRTLSDESRSLDLMNRYETRFDRQFARAHRCLIDLRRERILPLEPNKSLKTEESIPKEPGWEPSVAAEPNSSEPKLPETAA